MSITNNVNPPMEELHHYGVKGMKWGVRKDRPNGVSRKVDRMARKDAKEFVEAKAYYGEGAGTRRKLIKGKVEGRSKNTPGYKKVFDKYVSEQDTARAADKAISKRRRTDAANTTKKTVKATARAITGQAGNAAALVAIGLAGKSYLDANPRLKRDLQTKATRASRTTMKKGSRFLNENVLNKKLYIDPSTGKFYYNN